MILNENFLLKIYVVTILVRRREGIQARLIEELRTTISSSKRVLLRYESMSILCI